ncbi:MAG: MotA/TolQ/ExbB proton channel family protein [Myxococcota bacterium]
MDVVTNESPYRAAQTVLEDPVQVRKFPWLRNIALFILLPAFVGFLTTIYKLVVAFDAVALVNPEDKTQMLQEAIKHAMTATVIGLCFAILGLGVTAVLYARWRGDEQLKVG